jgi:hypothetical protein
VILFRSTASVVVALINVSEDELVFHRVLYTVTVLGIYFVYFCAHTACGIFKCKSIFVLSLLDDSHFTLVRMCAILKTHQGWACWSGVSRRL